MKAIKNRATDRKEKETATKYYARTYIYTDTHAHIGIGETNWMSSWNWHAQTCYMAILRAMRWATKEEMKRKTHTRTHTHHLAHMHLRCVFFSPTQLLFLIFSLLFLIYVDVTFFRLSPAAAAAGVPHLTIRRRRKREKKWYNDCVFEMHSNECHHVVPVPTINQWINEKEPKKRELKHILSSFCFLCFKIVWSSIVFDVILLLFQMKWKWRWDAIYNGVNHIKCESKIENFKNRKIMMKTSQLLNHQMCDGVRRIAHMFAPYAHTHTPVEPNP